MDIGFGALIEKFEQYVGMRATRLLIFVIFVAVFALCARAIVDNLISPLLAFLSTPLWGSTLVELGLMALSVGLGVAFGIQVLAAFGNWKRYREAKEVLTRVEKLQDQVQTGSDRIFHQAEESVQEAQAVTEKARALLRSTTEIARALTMRADLTDDERAVLLSLFAESEGDLGEESPQSGLSAVSDPDA